MALAAVALCLMCLAAGSASAATATLVPNGDRLAGPFSRAADNTSSCVTATTGLYLAVSEDIDTPIEDACSAGVASAGFMFTAAANMVSHGEMELSSVGSVQTVSAISVRLRGRKTNNKVSTVTVEVRRGSDDGLVGTATAHPMTTSFADYSYPLSSLSLSQATLDGLYVRVIANISGTGPGTAIEVSTVNLDITYSLDPTVPVIVDNQTGDDVWRNANDSSYDIDFTDDVNLASFEVKVHDAAGGSGTLLQDWTNAGTISGISHTTDWQLPTSTWNALQEGTNYVSVRVTDSDGKTSTLVDAFTARKDTVAPNDFANSLEAATSADGWPRPFWSGATDGTSGVEHYRVFRGVTNCDNAVEVSGGDGVSGLEYVDRTATLGLTYCYYVLAYDRAGNASGGSNSWIQLFSMPGTPSSVIGTWAIPGNGMATLSWERSAGSTSYRIYEATAEGGPYSLVATVTDPNTSYVRTGLTNGTQYFYKVRGYNGTTESGDPAETLTQVGTLPGGGAIFSSCHAIVDGTWYLFGGNNPVGTGRDYVWQVDPLSGSARATEFTLPEVRSDCAASNRAGSAYLIGGGTSTAQLTSILRFTPDVGFHYMNGVLPSARWEFAGVTMPNGLIYAWGGRSGASTILDKVVRYDPVADTNTTDVATLPTPHAEGGLALLGGNAFWAGGKVNTSGTNSSTTYRDAFVTSPEGHTISTRATLPATSLGTTGMAALNDKIYLYCGSGSSGRIRVFDERAGATGSWTYLTSAWAGGSCQHVAARQIRGFVYAAGADNGTNILPEVYRFSPGGAARVVPGAAIAGAPSALNVTANGTSAADVSWTAGTNVQRYRVFRSTTNTERGALVEEEWGLVDAPTAALTDQGLACNTTYYYTVDGMGYDDRVTATTSQVSVTTGACPASPQVDTIVPMNDRDPALWWATEEMSGSCVGNSHTANWRAVDDDVDSPLATTCNAGSPGSYDDFLTSYQLSNDLYDMTNTALTGTADQIVVRVHGRGSKNVELQLYLANGTPLGALQTLALPAANTTVQSTISGLSLSQTDVNGIYADMRSTGNGITVEAFNLDVRFQPAASGVTISGFAHETESPGTWSECNGSTANVSLAINGTLTDTVPCNGTSGAFSFTGVDLGGADNVVTVYLDNGAAGNDGVLYTRNADTTSDITGLAVTQDRVRVRSESATSMTTAAINAYDVTQDATDLALVSSDGTSLATTGTTELHVDAGETFAPGGNVTATSVHVSGTYSGAAETLTLTGSGSGTCGDGPGIARPLCVDGGTLTAPATTLFQSAAASDIQSAAYNILRLEPVSDITPWYQLGAGNATVSATQLVAGVSGDPVGLSFNTHSPTLTVNGAMSVGCGSTLSGSVNVTTTITGSLSGCGVVNLTGGTFVQEVAANRTFGASGGDNALWTFNNVALQSSSGTNTITIGAGNSTNYLLSGNLAVGANTTLDLDDRTATIEGNFTNNGTLAASSSTVELAGTGTSTLAYAAPTSFNNLTIATASKTVAFDNDAQTNVAGTLTVNGSACGTPVALRSDIAGTAAELNVTGMHSVQFADIADVTAVAALTAIDSVDSAGTTGWTITEDSCGSGPPALEYVTGFEHGVLSTAGGGIAEMSSGDIAVDSQVVRNGAHSMRVSSANASAMLIRTVSGTEHVARFAVRFETLPSGPATLFVHDPVGGSDAYVKYDAGSGRLVASWLGGASTSSSMTISAGQWYVIDLRLDVGVNPRTIDWRVNGVGQTTASRSETASTLRWTEFGTNQSTQTYVAYYDDIALSATAADYPIGDGKVIALRPDGRVANGSDTNLSHDGGGALGALSHLGVDDSPMASDTKYLRQHADTTGTAYAELSLRNAGGSTAPRGVRGIVAHRTESGGAASAGARFRSGATETSVHAGAIPASLEYEGAMLTAPGADGWSHAELDALTARIGYATSLSDEPVWDAVLVEAEFPVDGSSEANLAMRVEGYDATGAGPNIAPAETELGSLLPGSTAYAETRVTVTTDAANGYTLAASDPDTNGALYSSGAASSIPWMDCTPSPVCSPASPGAWNGSGVAISAFGGSDTPDPWCNGNQGLCPDSGVAGELQDADLRWAPLASSAATITSAPGPTPSGDTTRIPVRLTVPATQTASSYTGEIHFTATAVP